MKCRKLFIGSYRLLIARNRRLITDLIYVRLSLEGKRGAIGDESTNNDIEQIVVKPSKTKVLIKHFFIRLQRRISDVANTGCYFVNVFKEWIGLTFCFILIRRKKARGILKSVRI